MGAWCETSTDFDLLVELIAHALADEETSTIQVAHHQSVARQKCKLVADFGIQMHLAWAQHLLDNREFVKMEGRFPSSDPRPGQDDVAYDSDEEERMMEREERGEPGNRVVKKMFCDIYSRRHPTRASYIAHE